MKKKVCCLILCVVCLLSSASCGGNRDGGAKTTPRIAVAVDTNEYTAGQIYCEAFGGELIEYTSSDDAVTAVQNGKADYVILNEYEARNFTDSGCDLEFFEKCGFQLEYRAVFKSDNTQLLHEFNSAIEILKNNGTFDKVKQAHIEGEGYYISTHSAEKSVLTMVCDPIFENRVCYDDNGDVTGTDVDCAKAICSYLGYGLAINTEDFDSMFSQLDSGEADFIMSAVEYTDARAQDYLFSDIYSTIEYNIYTKK